MTLLIDLSLHVLFMNHDHNKLQRSREFIRFDIDYIFPPCIICPIDHLLYLFTIINNLLFSPLFVTIRLFIKNSQENGM